MAEAFNNLDIFDEVDEIDNLNKRNLQSRQKIKQLKEWTIKNMVYSNVKIPSTWRQKLDYRDIMYSTLNKDKVFFKYLSQNNVQTDENKDNLTKRKKLIQKEEELLPNIEEKTVYDRKKTNMSTLMRTTNNFNFSNNNSTLLALSPNKSHTATNFRSGPKLKTGEMDNMERLAMKKRLEIKTFYKTENFASMKKSSSQAPSKKTVAKAKTEYGPFLNINSNVKKVEIKNREVKSLVEECNNFGPFYSHCPSCNNRNLSFYQNMNSDNAVKLLTFIRDKRLKSTKH